MRLGLAGWLVVLSALADAGAQTAPAGKLILDESAYCRAYVQFGLDRLSPAALKADGEKVLGGRGLWQIKRSVKNRLKKEFDETTWTRYAFHSFQWLQYGGSRDRANQFAWTAPAPAGWARGDFDDTSWLYQRRPFMVTSARGWFRRAGFFRFYFLVPDPSQAGGLRLKLAYRGGARVYLNGREIAQGHLVRCQTPATRPAAIPAGTLRCAFRGADYPIGAYVKLQPDGSPVKTADHRGRGDSLSFIGELPESWDAAAPAVDRKRKVNPEYRTIARRWVDRPTFETVAELRRRTIGPVVLPAKDLRQGVNVLAIEIHTSDIHPIALAGRQNWKTPYYGDVSWSHGQITTLRLTARDGVPSAMGRPAGVQVWAEDMHRPIISSEFVQAGVPTAPLRFVGANGGVFSAQIVVGTDRALTGLKVAPGALTGPGGARIPASALKVLATVPHRLDEWHGLGWGRGGMPHCREVLCAPAALALARHGPAGAAAQPRDKRIAELAKLHFFDHIGSAPPDARATIPADSCRPVWVTLAVPPDAKPGRYTGTIRVAANGLEPMTVPVQADVAAWRVPNPKHFQANAALEQSPYGVAMQYGVSLWSDRHFELMAASFRQLALVGNDWLNVPVISYTEFGNVTDSMIPWIRRPDGKLTWDYSILDRYLDLAVEHLGKPRVINFIVMHGTVGDRAGVRVLDQATGRVSDLNLHSDAPGYEAHWRAFARSLHAHMRAKGLADAMYWGFFWDSVADPELVRLLAQVTPDVWWTSGAHRGKEHFYVRAYSQLLPFRLTERSMMGWRQREFHVLLPRGGGSLIAGPGVAFPFTFRLMVDRSLVVGMTGVGRMGADYWKDSYIKGMRQEGFLRAGMPNHHMLWPGADGAEPSARFMALREGFQETEARIGLEQLLTRKALPAELDKKVRDVLSEHHRGTLFVPSMNASWHHVEMCRDWQQRSRRLFGVAAEAAAAVGLDLDRYAIAANVPARVKTAVPVTLRVWTPSPRPWKARSDRAWIVPGKSGGSLAGREVLPITLDATALPAGKTATGTLTITDTASGKTHTVAVAANVSKVFDYASPSATLDRKQLAFIPDDGKEPIDAVPGEALSRPVSFFNRSGVPVSWSASASLPWMKVVPASGSVAPGAMVTVTLTGRPGTGDAGYRDAVLTISEPAGQAVERIPLAVYVLPAYRAPRGLPKGTAAALTPALHKALLKARREWRPRWCGHEILSVAAAPSDFMPADGLERGQKVRTVLTMPAPSETIYRIAGRGYHALSAKVDHPASCKGYKTWGPHGTPPPWLRMRFEIYVDGALRAQSGWMSVRDGLRTLVVDDLAAAKEVRLVTRYNRYPPFAVTAAWWDVCFYAK